MAAHRHLTLRGARAVVMIAALAGTACTSHIVRTGRSGAHGTTPGTTVAVRAPEPLIVGVSTPVALEPAQVSARVRVTPDRRNRTLAIEWWNAEGVGGSHTVTLDGERAPVGHTCAMNQLTAGEYVVTAVVTQDDGTQIRRRTSMQVFGEGATLGVEVVPSAASGRR